MERAAILTTDELRKLLRGFKEAPKPKIIEQLERLKEAKDD